LKPRRKPLPKTVHFTFKAHPPRQRFSERRSPRKGIRTVIFENSDGMPTTIEKMREDTTYYKTFKEYSQEAKKRVSDAVESYRNGTMKTVPYEQGKSWSRRKLRSC
jgi:hypothetical protein